MLHHGRISFYSPFLQYTCGDEFCLNLPEKNLHLKGTVISVRKYWLFQQVLAGILQGLFVEIVQKVKARKNDEKRLSSLLCRS